MQSEFDENLLTLPLSVSYYILIAGQLVSKLPNQGTLPNPIGGPDSKERSNRLGLFGYSPPLHFTDDSLSCSGSSLRVVATWPEKAFRNTISFPESAAYSILQTMIVLPAHLT